MIRSKIEVSLGERSYPIYVGKGMLASLAPTCDQHGIPRRVVMITDSHVAGHYLQSFQKHLVHFGFEVTAIVIPPGESQKSLTRAQAVFTTMLEKRIGRKSAVLALGGGVVGDLSGFIAATYHRGIPLVQMPTSLLSQVDSSIGGKTAVNHPLGKNMIGAFYQPAFVWTDISMLKTLPLREIVCGLGEIVKYGIILDETLFSSLEKSLEKILALDEETVLNVQGVCSSIKADLVSRDEREEKGVRIVLNCGHTIGHALEAAGRYKMLKHGDAVLLGLVAESFLARELRLLEPEAQQRIVTLIRRIPLQSKKPSLKQSEILKAMGRDKKSVAGKARFVLPTRVGGTTVVEDISTELIMKSLQYMNEWASKKQ